MIKKNSDVRETQAMIKIWGRKTSSNVQKAMWAVGELNLEHERIDIGGGFGKNKEPAYLTMNPNGLVPTLEEEDGFLLWESNSVVRYLAGKHDRSGVLEPKDPKQRALASQWMDWQLSVVGPAIHHAFWGLIRTPPEKRDMAAIKTSQEKTTDAMKMLDARLSKTQYVAGTSFSYGDIPVGIMCYRFVQLVPERPSMPNLDRWYEMISKRKAFQDHVGAIPLT
jgi:glutathione S-transferase